MRGVAIGVEGHPSSDTASPRHLLPRWEKESVSTLPLDLPVNSCTLLGDRTLARLGPDEWLLIGPEDEAETIAVEIERELAGRFFTLVDVSHRNVAFEVSGPDAAAILNAGCPLDLHPSRFPPGSGTRTLLGKAEIVLIRAGEETVFRVECWRSFAAYVHGFLMQGAADV